MDLAKFDTRENAEEGINIPLVIYGNEVLGDDEEPVVFKTKGIADPTVHGLVLKAMKAPDVMTAKEVVESDMRLCYAAIVGWSSNFLVEGEKLGFSKKNLERIMANPVVRKAVIAPIFDEARFMKGSCRQPKPTSDSLLGSEPLPKK